MTPCSIAPGGEVLNEIPRVAFLADSFHEVNGAARTCRELEAFARRRGYPFFSIRCGPSPRFECDRENWVLELSRSRFAIPVDTDLRFDPVFLSVSKLVEEKLRKFQPEVIHITSPGDLGILGAFLGHRLKIPLVLSWHTNLHEFASRRVLNTFHWLPRNVREGSASTVERFVLDRLLWFFGRGEAILAPNRELVDLLRTHTGKPVFLMERGIDTNVFHPSLRNRTDETVVLGYVGRLMPEKNVRLLAMVEKELRKAGHNNFRFVIAGGGTERAWLEENLSSAEFTGIVDPNAVAPIYANLDVFVFPSRTDTFGNVVQEALATGVPAVVTNCGGPKFIVNHGLTGFVAQNDEEFCRYAVQLARDGELRRRMGAAARKQMESRSWDRIFETVYDAYRAGIHNYNQL